MPAEPKAPDGNSRRQGRLVRILLPALLLTLILPAPAVPAQPLDPRSLVVPASDLGENWSLAAEKQESVEEGVPSFTSYHVTYLNAADYSSPRKASFSVFLCADARQAEELLVFLELNPTGFLPSFSPTLGLGDSQTLRNTARSTGRYSSGYGFRVGPAVAFAEAGQGSEVDAQQPRRQPGQPPQEISAGQESELDAQALNYASLQEQRLREALPATVSVAHPETIRDIGTLGGLTSSAADINTSGQVVGRAQSPAGDEHAFVWADGTIADLGTLAGSTSAANEINAAGQVVGHAQTESGPSHAFLWEKGVMADLGTLPDHTDSAALGINATGQVVGYSEVGERRGTQRAFLYSEGGMTELPTPGGSDSIAGAINASGQVAGSAGRHAALWTNGVMTDLGTLPNYDSSRSVGINASGEVVGYAERYAGPFRQWSGAFLHTQGAMIDLGTFGGRSQALGINNRGQVVGWSETERGIPHAFVWENGVMTDLNSLLPNGSTWILAEAHAINDSGQIVGEAYFNSPRHAFRLTLTSATAPVPAPVQIPTR
jgi:probable HAF family extracellular repeat protein